MNKRHNVDHGTYGPIPKSHPDPRCIPTPLSHEERTIADEYFLGDHDYSSREAAADAVIRSLSNGTKD